MNMGEYAMNMGEYASVCRAKEESPQVEKTLNLNALL